MLFLRFNIDLGSHGDHITQRASSYSPGEVANRGNDDGDGGSRYGTATKIRREPTTHYGGAPSDDDHVLESSNASRGFRLASLWR